MVKSQEVPKNGRNSGVAFAPTLKVAVDIPGPVLVSIPVDYRDDHKLDGEDAGCKGKE